MDTPETSTFPVDPTKPETPAPATEEKKGGGLFGWFKNPFAGKPKEDAGLTGNPADAQQDPNVPPAVPEGLQPPPGVNPTELGTRAGVDSAGIAPTTPGMAPAEAPSTPAPLPLPAEAPAEAATAAPTVASTETATPGTTTPEPSATPTPDKIEVFK